MLLRSGRKKPYQIPLRGRQAAEKQFLLTNTRTPPEKPGNSYLSDRYVCNLEKNIPIQDKIQQN